MQIPSNRLSDIISFFKKELAQVYTESELRNIISWVLEKQVQLSATDTLTNQDLRINESELRPLEKMCFELKANKPIQYVLGEAEFYGMKFKVNENVLIPRPETEELVEKVISSLKSQISSLHSRPSSFAPCMLDIGTGSGCIPIAIKKSLPAAHVYALDVSAAALEIAKHNAQENKTEITFFEGDILKENVADLILERSRGNKFDVIVSNPPYVLNAEKGTLHARVIEFEPHLALFVEDTDPILFYRKIALHALKLLKPGGQLWFECHTDYVPEVGEMLVQSGYTKVVQHPDLSGLARFTEATDI